MLRTERESDRRREVADLLVSPRPAERSPNGEGFSGKTLTNWAFRKGKSGLIATKQLARTPEPPLPKGTELCVQITKL